MFSNSKEKIDIPEENSLGSWLDKNFHVQDLNIELDIRKEPEIQKQDMNNNFWFLQEKLMSQSEDAKNTSFEKESNNFVWKKSQKSIFSSLEKSILDILYPKEEFNPAEVVDELILMRQEYRRWIENILNDSF